MDSVGEGTRHNTRNDLLCTLIGDTLFDLRLSRKLSGGAGMCQAIDVTLTNTVEYATQLGKPFCGDGCYTHHVLLRCHYHCVARSRVSLGYCTM